MHALARLGSDNRPMAAKPPVLRHWPLFGLRLRTPRLELRLPSLADLDELAGLAAAGVHDPAVQPFGVPWTDVPPDQRARGVLQYHWRQLAAWSAPGLDAQPGGEHRRGDRRHARRVRA